MVSTVTLYKLIMQFLKIIKMTLLQSFCLSVFAVTVLYCTFSSTDNNDPGRSLTSTIIYRQHPTLSAHSTHIIGHIDLDNILALRQGNLRGQEPPS